MLRVNVDGDTRRRRPAARRSGWRSIRQAGVPASNVKVNQMADRRDRYFDRFIHMPHFN
jgi:hypothetical protein